MVKNKKIFSGKLLKLYVERKKFPNGYVSDFEIVKHPGAILVVPFLEKDKIILIRQFRPVIKSYIWELPAGTLGKNEPPLSCAKRELIEEIGYRATSWKKIGYIYPAPGYATEKIMIYTAKNLVKETLCPEEDEMITPVILSRNKIKLLIKSGKIVDAKTLAALMLAGIV